MNFAALRYEELSLNAFPSIHTEVCDGWILRFREGGDWRDSCVLPLYLSTRSYEDKIDFCEKKFAARSLPCAFKMTPNVPAALDQQLEQRGYVIMGKTRVLECRAGSLPALPRQDGKNPMPEPDCCRRGNKGNKIEAFLRKNGTVIAGGIGIFEEDTMGLYDIHVSPGYRRQGLGTAICRTLMEAGFQAGVKSVHLQVLASSVEALSLYRSLGFQEIYLYWYRVRMAFSSVSAS